MGNQLFQFENVGARVNLNGIICDAAAYFQHERDEAYWTGEIVYEVVRIVKGIPLFFEDHYERLCASLTRAGADPVIAAEVLTEQMRALCGANAADDCNIKIWVSRGNYFMNINRSFYPPPAYYENGVAVELLEHTRGDPNIKRVVAGYKEKVREIMERTGAFELLLYDEARNLTEGSRTNLFFVREGRLYTAPDAMILKGVIRKVIFAAAAQARIPIDEQPVRLEELDAVEAAFITGTSIRVLPIAAIGKREFRSARHPTVRAIHDAVERIVQTYLENHK